MWKVKSPRGQSYILPSCQFVPRYCSEESLKTVVNGEAKFFPGEIVQSLEKRELKPHSATVGCNDNGFYMSVNEKTWRETKQVKIWIESSSSSDQQIAAGILCPSKTHKLYF